MMILTLVRILLISIVTCKHFLVEVEDGEKKGSDDSEDGEKKGSDYSKYQGKGGSDYSVFPSRRKCGRPNIIMRSRIVNGQKVKKNEFPWQVLLTMPCNYDGKLQDECKVWNGRKDTTLCGGSVLTKDTILTAAHCTAPVSAQTITVWTGEHDFTKEDGESNHMVCSKTEHPGYNPSKGPMYDLDIAILHLCQPLIFSKGKILVLSLLEVLMT